MVENRGVRGKILDFCLALVYIRSYLLVIPLLVGRGRHALLFFNEFPYLPSNSPVLLDFSHFHLSPLMKYTINLTGAPSHLTTRGSGWSSKVSSKVMIHSDHHALSKIFCKVGSADKLNGQTASVNLTCKLRIHCQEISISA